MPKDVFLFLQCRHLESLNERKFAIVADLFALFIQYRTHLPRHFFFRYEVRANEYIHTYIYIYIYKLLKYLADESFVKTLEVRYKETSSVDFGLLVLLNKNLFYGFNVQKFRFFCSKMVRT